MIHKSQGEHGGYWQMKIPDRYTGINIKVNDGNCAGEGKPFK